MALANKYNNAKVKLSRIYDDAKTWSSDVTGRIQEMGEDLGEEFLQHMLSAIIMDTRGEVGNITGLPSDMETHLQQCLTAMCRSIHYKDQRMAATLVCSSFASSCKEQPCQRITNKYVKQPYSFDQVGKHTLFLWNCFFVLKWIGYVC